MGTSQPKSFQKVSKEMEGLSKIAMKRLQKELKEPCPLGLSLAPLGDDLTQFHANVQILDDGAYSGIIFHLLLEVPSDYPNKAPSAYFRSKIAYENGAQVNVAGKGDSICLDLLGNFSYVHTEWGSTASGWSPANSLQTILIQLQGSLCDMLSTNPTSVKSTRDSAASLNCSCGHSNSNVYPPLSKGMEKSQTPESPALLLGPKLNHLSCYITGSNAADDKDEIFGFGVGLGSNGTLSTTGELLSKSAFDSGVRRSSQNSVYDYFLPIYISADHWTRAKKVWQETFSSMYCGMISKMRNRKSEKAEKDVGRQALFCLCSLMNSCCVSTCEANGVAHDAFIGAYFCLLRIVKWIKDTLPSVSKAADERIVMFLRGHSSKDDIPNLGEFLILLHAAKSVGWEEVRESFLAEVDTRNVRWFKNPKLQSDAHYPDRLKMTFEEAATSRKIVCFQVRFLDVSRTTPLEFVDLNVPEQLMHNLKEIHMAVGKHSNWAHYIQWCGLPKLTMEERQAQLVRAVTRSRDAGYHGGGGGGGRTGGGRGRGRR